MGGWCARQSTRGRGGTSTLLACAQKNARQHAMMLPGGFGNDPYGTRTRVAGVKGRSPRPLDDGAVVISERAVFKAFKAHASSGDADAGLRIAEFSWKFYSASVGVAAFSSEAEFSASLFLIAS